MKNLHFYIQCVILLVAGSIAVQIPFNKDLFINLMLIEFFLGFYQLGMSTLLMAKLSYQPLLLRTHFYASWCFILSLILLGIISPEWMNTQRWQIALFVVPWGLAMLFLVALDEMERYRHYRL